LIDEPLLTSTLRDERLELAAAGAWTADHARTLEPIIENVNRTHAGVRAVAIDIARIERLDTFGAWLLERLIRTWSAKGCEPTVAGLSDRYRSLIEQVRHTNRASGNRTRGNARFGASLATVGRIVVALMRDLAQFVDMLGLFAAAVLRTLIRPHRLRLTSVVHHLERVAWQAAPVILLVTFLIGCIIAQQGIFHFRRFGAEVYVVDMVGVLVLREIGVLMVAVMVAGRSGSAYTAELGAMKMREEIDALRTMGFDPAEVLVLPRLAALIVGVPILTILGSMSALYGGGLVCWLYGGINPDIFLSRLREAISLNQFEIGMIKAPFMALIIGIVACAEGFAVKGSAESLGQHTTASVVKAIFFVIVLDGVFAMFFAAIGK
jgi:phospholipid/cholesterol/gamma-HCH transport system permease protein